MADIIARGMAAKALSTAEQASGGEQAHVSEEILNFQNSGSPKGVVANDGTTPTEKLLTLRINDITYEISGISKEEIQAMIDASINKLLLKGY